jgi:hypothetical protein
MRTICHLRHHLAQVIGTGLVLVSLFGCLTLPTASVSSVEPTAYREYPAYPYDPDDRDYRGPWDPWGYRDYREYRPYSRPRYELPDRYTIHKGKKCELQCERVWGTRDYQCREYRC